MDAVMTEDDRLARLIAEARKLAPDITPDVIIFYRLLGDVELQTLRAAFVADLKDGADFDFCAGRLCMIDSILLERGILPRNRTRET